MLILVALLTISSALYLGQNEEPIRHWAKSQEDCDALGEGVFHNYEFNSTACTCFFNFKYFEHSCDEDAEKPTFNPLHQPYNLEDLCISNSTYQAIFDHDRGDDCISPEESLSLDNLPIILVSERTILDGKTEEYKEAYLGVAEYFEDNIPGVKTFFYSNDEENPNVTYDVQWYKDVEAFNDQLQVLTCPMDEELEVLTQTMLSLTTVKGVVFGDYPQSFVDFANKAGAKFDFLTPAAGFIRESADGQEGPPVIFYTTRYVLEGHQEDYTTAWQVFSDYLKENSSGTIAHTMAFDNEDPTLIHNFFAYSNLEVVDEILSDN